MKNSMENLLFVSLSALIFLGNLADSLPYDYSASIECLVEPPKAQYGGGILSNPNFDSGLKGWSTFGNGIVIHRISETGNKFAVVHNRRQPYQSVSQKIHLQKGMLYTFSAWVKTSERNATVGVVFKTSDDFIHAGAVEAKSGCWSMLKGGLSVEASGLAELYFESQNTEVEIWVDSASLQPFTEEEWRAHQSESIQKARTRLVRFGAVDASNTTLPNATISITQTRPGFPFGCAIPAAIVNNNAYQSWFTSRFTVTVFENEMKWYSTEASRGKEVYSVPDAMAAFAKNHRIAIRGHNVLWDDPKYQPGWVNALSGNDLRAAATKRVQSVVSRYKGQVIAWDVMNENLHFSYFEDKLGGDASAVFVGEAQKLDPNTLMFLNEYNTLEQPGDTKSTPAKYLEKLKAVQAGPSNGAKMAIGLEGHFDKPNIAYVRSALDTLAQAKLPIWLTEVDVGKDPNQASYLEQILREAYSHPAVQGIVMWASWHPEGCYRMCLTDNNFKNLPTGDVVDKLIAEWRSVRVEGTTSSSGFFEAQLVHGEYEIRLSHPAAAGQTSLQSLLVDAGSQGETVLRLDV